MTDPSLMPGSRVYERLLPLAAQDESLGWPLFHFIQGIGQSFAQLEELVRASADGPAWSQLLDVERCPIFALPFLAQFVGVRIPAGTSEMDARQLIRNLAGFRRGSSQSIIDAVKQTLTGNKTVRVIERPSGNAYEMTVLTRTVETPDTAVSTVAVMSQKPAGINLTYVISDLAIIDEGTVDIDSGVGDLDTALPADVI